MTPIENRITPPTPKTDASCMNPNSTSSPVPRTIRSPSIISRIDGVRCKSAIRLLIEARDSQGDGSFEDTSKAS